VILRRPKAHVENENWFAVFLDFAIVVIGVFIGIQVANWNAGRVEQAQASDLMARMISEGVDAQQDLREYRTVHADILDRNTRLSLRLQDGDACQIVDDAFKILLTSIGDFPPPRFSLSTATQALNTGQLRLIQNSTVRDSVQTIADEMTFLNRQWERYILPKQTTERETSQSAGLVITGAREKFLISSEEYDPDRYTLLTPERICTDTKVMALVSNTEVTHQIYLGYLEEVQAELDAYVKGLQTAAGAMPKGDD
jgi:hypothetical protein